MKSIEQIIKINLVITGLFDFKSVGVEASKVTK